MITPGSPGSFPLPGSGAWESALTNTLLPEDRIVSFLILQFRLLWIDQQQCLNFKVVVIENDWGNGANLEVLASKLSEDTSHTVKAICIVHNKIATGVTNYLFTIRKILEMEIAHFGNFEERRRNIILMYNIQSYMGMLEECIQLNI